MKQTWMKRVSRKHEHVTFISFFNNGIFGEEIVFSENKWTVAFLAEERNWKITGAFKIKMTHTHSQIIQYYLLLKPIFYCYRNRYESLLFFSVKDFNFQKYKLNEKFKFIGPIVNNIENSSIKNIKRIIWSGTCRLSRNHASLGRSFNR